MTILTQNQVKVYGPRTDDKLRADYGASARLTATVRYDDRCNNGHNTFSVTGDVRVMHRLEACGCLHDDIMRLFPELADSVKWHLTSSDGPLHYLANTVYHAEMGRYDFARGSAVWPEATENDFTYGGRHWLEQRLIARLPKLMADFRAAVESLGFTY